MVVCNMSRNPIRSACNEAINVVISTDSFYFPVRKCISRINREIIEDFVRNPVEEAVDGEIYNQIAHKIRVEIELMNNQ